MLDVCVSGIVVMSTLLARALKIDVLKYLMVIIISMSQLTVYYILAVQFRTHSVGEKVYF